MAHRAFTDVTGVLWQVWEVIPQWADRRAGNARRTDVNRPTGARGLEQRREPDRRRGLPDRIPRVRLGNGLDGGWLAFESSGQRRRLSPIPAGWEEASDVELERMCQRAAAAGAPRRLIE